MAFPATRLRRLRSNAGLRALVRETELGPGLLVRAPFGDKREDAVFLRREGFQRGGTTGRAHDVQHSCGDQRVERGLAGGGGPDRLYQARSVDVLEQVSVRPGPDRLVHRLLVVRRGEKHHARVGPQLLELAANFQAGSVGQADVEQHDIGPFLATHRQRGGGRARLADEAQARHVFQQRVEAGADEPAVVHDHEADGGGRRFHVGAAVAGNVSTMRVPAPGWLVTRSSPRSSSARARRLPSPWPAVAAWPGSNPQPSSCTSRHRLPWSS